MIAAAVAAGLCSTGAAVHAQAVQKPAIYLSGSNEQHGATFTESLRRRLSVVFAVNPQAPRRWGLEVHVLNPYQSPIIYSATLLESCGERWCWHTTYTGTCRSNQLNDCADRMFNVFVDFANSN